MKNKTDAIQEIVRYNAQETFLFHHNFRMENYPCHWHNAVEIIMPIENVYHVDVNNQMYHLNEYDILIIPSGELHEMLAPDSKGRRIILQFSFETLNTVRSFINVSYIYAKTRLITSKNEPELHESVKTMLLEMLDEHLNRPTYYEVGITNKIISITLLLVRRYKEGENALNENLIKRKEHVAKFNECIYYINRHCKENLTLDMAAQAIGFSKFHFARWFRQMADLSFSDYLTKTRIEKAEAMLLGTSLLVTEIALNAGFQSVTTFNRIFKEQKNCTPTEFRNFYYLKQQAGSSCTVKDKCTLDTGKMLTLKTPVPGGIARAPNVALPGACRVNDDGMLINPFIWADIPDPDVIRVSEAYYMISTAMHFNPGIPIMKSIDLVNWETVNYVYDILDDSDACALRNEAHAYGKGTWAGSLRYRKGSFYVVAASYTTNKTYIFQTEDIEKGLWRRYELNEVYHDPSLLFDDDERVYLVYGSGTIKVTELTPDVIGIKQDGLNRVIIEQAVAGGNSGLPAEGSHIYKINGRYYLFLIAWPQTGSAQRVQLCYRADCLEGPYEGHIVLDDNLGYKQQGVAQGGIVDTPDGRWYAMLFQDHGSVGRIPVLVPIVWSDDWPIFGTAGKAPVNMPLPIPALRITRGIAASDEFYHNPNGKGFGAANTVDYRYTHIPVDISDIFMENQAVELIENGSFEYGTANWGVLEIASIAMTDDETYDNSPVLYVNGRATTQSGPRQDITGKVVPGGVYEAFARVKYNEGPPSKDFNICIRNGDTWEGIQIMGTGRLLKGEWGEIRCTYTLPEDADVSETNIFIETPWSYQPKKDIDMMDFYVESVSVTVKKLHKNTKTMPGENDYPSTALAFEWQWNHNPDNNLWSLTERPGYLRLKTGYLSHDLLDARNTLTQRTFGPKCAGTAALDVSGMRDGDVAGLAALQESYGYVGVKMVNGERFIIMVNASSGHAQEIESIPLWQNCVYLRVDFDFNDADKACFFYSPDELNWQPVGDTLSMQYKLSHFTGYRYALFYYATQLTNGYLDFKYFRISDDLAHHNKDLVILDAYFGSDTEVFGLKNEAVEISIHMEALPFDTCNGLYFSMPLPDCLNVSDVVFCRDNIKGNAVYTVENRQLKLSVTGETVSFSNSSSDLFALLRFSVTDYVTEDTIITIKPDYLYADGINTAYRTHDMQVAVTLTAPVTHAIAKKLGYANPLISHAYGGDPWAMEHDDRLYLYLTADKYEYNDHGRLIKNTYEKIHTIHVISSADLINWTDHGEINVAGSLGAAAWASHSRTPAAAKKTVDGKERFFLYFTNDASNIGVLTSDSPVGPWTDPIGGPLIHSGIAGVKQVTGCIDPAVLVDDDGSVYMYFGGGLPSTGQTDALHPCTAMVIKLGDDMVSTVGEAVMIDAPAFFEDSGIHKYMGKYYYSYCSNSVRKQPQGYPQNGEIAYMMSDHPMGPFTYAGTMLKNPHAFFGVGGNSHHCVFTFKSQWFIAYHAQTLGKALGRVHDYRSPHINRLDFYNDGHIRPVSADMKGVRLPLNVNPFKRMEAETFAWSAGVSVANQGVDENEIYVTDINDGDWLAVANVDFGTSGAAFFTARVASETGCDIEIRINSPQGELIGKLGVGATGGLWEWALRSCDVKRIAGVYTIFFVFKGDNDDHMLNFDYWIFK